MLTAEELWKQVGKWRALERMQQLSPSGSLALVVWGPYSLDSSLLGSLKKKNKAKDQPGNKRGEESLRVFSRVRAPRPRVAGPRGCRSTW